MDKFKQGFISLPFLIVLSVCLSLSSLLMYKIRIECEIMENMKEVNFQVQHERKILEIIFCIIQCDVPDELWIEVDDVAALVQFEGDLCYITDVLCTMIVTIDKNEKVLRNVVVEK